MIEPEHPRLPVVRRCALVSIGRSGLHHRPAGETPLDLAPMRPTDARFLETPWYARGGRRGTCGARATRSAAGGCGG